MVIPRLLHHASGGSQALNELKQKLQDLRVHRAAIPRKNPHQKWPWRMVAGEWPVSTNFVISSGQSCYQIQIFEGNIGGFHKITSAKRIQMAWMNRGIWRDDVRVLISVLFAVEWECACSLSCTHLAHADAHCRAHHLVMNYKIILTNNTNQQWPIMSKLRMVDHRLSPTTVMKKCGKVDCPGKTACFLAEIFQFAWLPSTRNSRGPKCLAWSEGWMRAEQWTLATNPYSLKNIEPREQNPTRYPFETPWQGFAWRLFDIVSSFWFTH